MRSLSDWLMINWEEGSDWDKTHSQHGSGWKGRKRSSNSIQNRHVSISTPERRRQHLK